MLEKKRIIVKSGYHRRKNCPVTLFLKEKIEGVKLIEEEEGKEIVSRWKEMKMALFFPG